MTDAWHSSILTGALSRIRVRFAYVSFVSQSY